MRPLKLTMSAFGPYAGEEIVDFTLLKDKKIFLITGPTGAGKTTIFDAISFAIYGKASGGDRESENFRSDFAEEDRITYVELSFLLKGKEYYIKRTPQQQKKKRKGDGYTEQKSDAELMTPEGKVYTGVTEVNKKVQELFGISYEQFKQIVMIPQGEFRELLSSNSKDREEIFRRVFGTYGFLKIQEKLDLGAKELENKIKSLKEQRGVFVKGISFPGNEEFLKLTSGEVLNIPELLILSDKLIDEDKIIRQELIELIHKKEEEIASISQDITRGTNLNKELKALGALRDKKRELEDKKESYYAQEYRLERCKKALSLKGKEDYLSSRSLYKEQCERDLQKDRESLANALKVLTLREEKLREQEELKDYRKALGESIAELKKDIASVKEYEGKKLNINNIQRTYEVLKRDRDTKQQLIDRSSKELVTLGDFVLKHQGVPKELVIKENHYKEVEELEGKLLKLYQEQDRLLALRKEFSERRNLCKSKEEVYLRTKELYDTLDLAFKKGQAGILGEELEEGRPCPVCGSTHHPSPAKKGKDIPSEEELKKAKIIYENNNKDFNELLNELAGLREKGSEQGRYVEELKKEISPKLTIDIMSLPKEELIDNINSQLQDAKSNLSSLKLEIAELSKQDKLLSQAIKEEEALKIKLRALEEEKKALEESYLSAYSSYEREKEILSRLEKSLPQGISSLTQLQKVIIEKEEELNILEENFKKAQEAYNAAVNEKSALEGNIRTREEALYKAKEELILADTELREALRLQGFQDREEYSSYKLSDKEINALEEDIKNYNQELKSIRDLCLEREKALQGAEPVSLESLEEQLIIKGREKTELSEKERLIYSRIAGNEKNLEAINKIQDSLEKLEEEYSVIGELSKVSRGFNSERISFERYVLAAYFDEIITAANVRLNKMTSGRYALYRIQEKTKGSHQQGLDLEVYDNYTGKARHVKTLSGGESFKASLSMALGLADVVQANAGGISLETMFVDEGFGTLDPESLDNAISTLIELQKSGRLVGIISHVPELKERIEAKLIITTGIEGSHASFS
ncbi:MAG: AAA family ATPase [Clostridiaceae bacterium]